VVDGQFMGSFSHLSEFMRYQPKNYRLDCLSRGKRSWIYISQCKSTEWCEWVLGSISNVWELVFYSRFFGCKGTVKSS